jgi:Putative transposase of IS4/5 family (DUF4096)
MGVQGKSYPTDLTDDQWEIASHLIPPAKTGGRPRKIEMREVVNALMYMVKVPIARCSNIIACSSRFYIAMG